MLRLAKLGVDVAATPNEVAEPRALDNLVPAAEPVLGLEPRASRLQPALVSMTRMATRVSELGIAATCVRFGGPPNCLPNVGSILSVLRTLVANRQSRTVNS